MARNIIATFMFCVLSSWVLAACDSGQNQGAPLNAPQAQLPPVQPVQQLPVQQPIAQVAAPPATPLIPLSEEEGEAVATKGSKSKGTTKPKVPTGVDEVDIPLPGKKIEGDELIGNYGCQVDAEGLPTGPFKLPALGCRIYRAEDGTLKLGPTTKNIAAIKGNIQNPTDAGFFIVGGFKFPGNSLDIKTRMQRKPGDPVVYSGKGRGALNDGKGMKTSYTFTMTKK